MYVPHVFIHSSVDRHLGCFHLLTVNNTGMNMGVQILVPVLAFNSFRYILKNEIAGFYGNSTFNFFRNY